MRRRVRITRIDLIATMLKKYLSERLLSLDISLMASWPSPKSIRTPKITHKDRAKAIVP
jgi:hypothetical protein